jgi:hypothetical protein
MKENTTMINSMELEEWHIGAKGIIMEPGRMELSLGMGLKSTLLEMFMKANS